MSLREKLARNIRARTARHEAEYVAANKDYIESNINAGLGTVTGDTSRFSDCSVSGSVTIGEGSVVVDCIVYPGAELIVGAGCIVQHCRVAGRLAIGAGSTVNHVTTGTQASLQIGSDSVAVSVTAAAKRSDIRIGDRAVLYAVNLKCRGKVRIGTDAVIMESDMKLRACGGVVIGDRISVAPDAAVLTGASALTPNNRYQYGNGAVLTIQVAHGPACIGNRFSMFASDCTIEATKFLSIGDNFTVACIKHNTGSVLLRSGKIRVGSNVFLVRCAYEWIHSIKRDNGHMSGSIAVGSGATILVGSNSRTLCDTGQRNPILRVKEGAKISI